MAKIIYARGFPYGAPLVMVRGGATRIPEVRLFLRSKGFHMDGSRFAWTTYMNGPEFRDVLLALRDTLGCEVVPKDDLDANYIIDLDIDTDAERKAGA